MSVSKVYFDREQLLAYQRSIQFVAWSSQLLEKIPTKLAVCDQLDRVSCGASPRRPVRLRFGALRWSGAER
jgi:hypothetical protein